MRNNKKMERIRTHALAKRKPKRNAFLLIAVLLIVSAVTLGALAFTQSMLVGHEESRLAGETIQARYAADSGIDAARLFLAFAKQTRDEEGGTYSNANNFQAVSVFSGRDPMNPCNYSFVAPDLDEEGRFSGVRYGMQNESARLNVNVLQSSTAKCRLAKSCSRPWVEWICRV